MELLYDGRYVMERKEKDEYISRFFQRSVGFEGFQASRKYFQSEWQPKPTNRLLRSECEF